MRKANFNLLLLFVFLMPLLLLAQAPQPTDSICPIPLYTGSFYSSGIPEGQQAPDFTVFNSNGQPFNLASALQLGKPVLLINGSLTCPVFRNKIATINQIQAQYGSAIATAVVLTVEAHPTGISPYFGYVNITGQNQQEGILFPQPQTYGQRLGLSDTLQQRYSISVPVFVDLPCNSWWSTYGPAPNNAYLIRPNGEVFSKHGWFDRAPDRIFCDIDSLLGSSSGLCQPAQGTGSFQANVLNANSYGFPGSTLFNYVDLINAGSVPVEILIMTLEEQLPDTTWQTAYCADICYSPGVDSIVLWLAGNDTLHFSLDFFTGPSPALGKSKIGFRNQQNVQNKFSFWLEASTFSSGLSAWAATETTMHIKAGSAWPLQPNEQVRGVFDLQGRCLPKQGFAPEIPGVYVLHTNFGRQRIWVRE